MYARLFVSRALAFVICINDFLLVVLHCTTARPCFSTPLHHPATFAPCLARLLVISLIVLLFYCFIFYYLYLRISAALLYLLLFLSFHLVLKTKS